MLLEIHSARGGEEARIFASELFSAYRRYFRSNKWSADVLDEQRDPGGGLRSVTVLISGKGIDKIRREAGEHQVQRKTKSRKKDRIHTSSARVAVIEPHAAEGPSLDDVTVETFRGSGPGGQHRNVRDTAVRARDNKSGIEVTITSGRSQDQNKRIAMEVLSARLEERESERAAKKMQNQRQGRVKPLRTYDYVRGMIRCTNGKKTGKLKAVMNGNFELVA